VECCLFWASLSLPRSVLVWILMWSLCFSPAHTFTGTACTSPSTGFIINESSLLHGNIQLDLGNPAVDARCGEKDFPGTSANSAMILEFNPAQEISSLQAQGMSMAFALLGFAVIWCVWARSLVGIAKEVRRWLGEEGRF
jgi:hypothetical protein